MTLMYVEKLWKELVQKSVTAFNVDVQMSVDIINLTEQMFDREKIYQENTAELSELS